MKEVQYLAALAAMTAALSLSYPDAVSLYLLPAVVSYPALIYVGERLFFERAGYLHYAVLGAILVVLLALRVYAVVPPVLLLLVSIYLYFSGKLTYSRATYTAFIASYSYPLSQLASTVTTVLDPAWLLQVSALAVVKEAVPPGKKYFYQGLTAYSLLFVPLVSVSFGRWALMLVEALLALYALRRLKGGRPLPTERAARLTALYAVALFLTYVLPVYAVRYGFVCPAYFQLVGFPYP